MIASLLSPRFVKLALYPRQRGPDLIKLDSHVMLVGLRDVLISLD
jgi:hypothetical protein